MSQHSTILNPASTLPAAASTVKAREESNDLDNDQITPGILSVQTKLSVGAADDPLEYEADAIADKVMRMPEPGFIRRKCAHCEEEEKVSRKPLASFIQKKAFATGGYASDAVDAKINSSRGKGNNIDAGTMDFMETRFGTDFSQVKIHTGSESVQMNRDLNARAFTVGNDIYFNESEYIPQSHNGKHLLAHELTHTIQQGVSRGALQRNTLIQRALAPVVISAIATEIWDATKIWGTDEEKIFLNLQKLNRDPANINDLITTYRIMYKKSLVSVLRDEMSGSELRFALELINIVDDPRKAKMIDASAPAGPAGYKRAAERLWDAIHGPGTDEETIYAVLVPFNRDDTKLSTLKSAYTALTGNSLISDIRGDMSGTELRYALYLMNEPDSNQQTAASLEAVIRNNPIYQHLDSESKDRVENIIAIAAQLPYGENRGHRFYYLRKLNIALSTPFQGTESPDGGYGCSPDLGEKNKKTVEEALQIESAGVPGVPANLDETIVATGTHKVERIVKTEEDGLPVDKKYYVDNTDSTNIRVLIKVKLIGPEEDVNKMKGLEHAIERSVATKGYHLDIEFVDHTGDDVFKFTVTFCKWPNSGNWATGPVVLSHEVHHALGLGDRYDYIESHSVNPDMNVAMRLVWFEQELYKTAPNNPRSKMSTNENPLLNDDACMVAFEPGPARASCMETRAKFNPAGVP